MKRSRLALKKWRRCGKRCLARREDPKLSLTWRKCTRLLGKVSPTGKQSSKPHPSLKVGEKYEILKKKCLRPISPPFYHSLINLFPDILVGWCDFHHRSWFLLSKSIKMPRRQWADRGKTKDSVAYKLGNAMKMYPEFSSKLRTSCVASLRVLSGDSIERWTQTSDRSSRVQTPALPLYSVILGKGLSISEPHFHMCDSRGCCEE